ncbi:MAG TPA: PAS domain-containing protein [Candidatus Angelobacter sp.]|nr:PAS domain-containing protein [Candidatus Angelobacter sp.]
MHRFLQRLTVLDLYGQPAALRYGLALLFVLAALAANFLPQAGARLPFIFFFGAVALTARLCGFGPAVAATLLSGVLAEFFFLEPKFYLNFTATSLVQMLLFLVVCLIITSVALQKSAAAMAATDSQRRLAETLETITEGFITYSPDWTITYVNHAGAELCGSTAALMIGYNVWRLLPDTADTPLYENLARAMRDQQTVHFEFYYPTLKRWYRIAGYPGPQGLTAILQDVSEARQTAETLSTTERRLQFAQVAAQFGSWEWNVKTNDLWWAEGIWILHGHAIGSLPPTFENWLSFVHPDDRERCRQAVERSLAAKSDYDTEYRTVWPDGTLHWIVSRGQVLLNEAGQPDRMVGMAMDITDRKLAEDALRESGERFRTLADSISQFAWMADSSGWIFWYNQRWFDYTGTTLEEMQGWGWRKVHHPDHVDRVAKRLQHSWDTGEPWEDTFPLRGRDGSYRWFLSRARPIRDTQGKIIRWFGTNTDVTEQMKAEDALRKSEKLAAAGRLAATIAHEINNPLEAVTNLLYLLRQNGAWDANARDYVAQAEHELARVAHVTRQTLGFYRDTTSPRLMNLAKTVEEGIALYQSRIQAKKIVVQREFDQTVEVSGLSGEIRQVISNLVANAIDAMPEGGTLRLRVRRGREFSNSNQTGGRIVIADTGSGIPREQRKKLFEPFYTTKLDVGTGLGLWVSREIIKKHGGAISLRSSVGPRCHGTVFSVFLPAASGVPSATPAQPAAR